MLMSGMSEIDVLVTGLPVSQFNDPAKRAELETKFVGIHQITPNRLLKYSPASEPVQRL